MKIDIWSDFACPFCYIGKRHLEAALGDRKDVEIIFHSFELDPNTAIHHDNDIHQLIANKYGISYTESKANNDQITKMAAAVGLEYNFDIMKPTNTFNAHRIAQFAKTIGKGNDFVEAAMEVYFRDGAFLNDEETLIAIGEKVGLLSKDVSRVFNSQEFLAPVRVDQTKALELGIQSVPFFLINEQYALSGAQPISVFENVIKQVTEQSVLEKPSSGPNCADSSCQL